MWLYHVLTKNSVINYYVKYCIYIRVMHMKYNIFTKMGHFYFSLYIFIFHGFLKKVYMDTFTFFTSSNESFLQLCHLNIQHLIKMCIFEFSKIAFFFSYISHCIICDIIVCYILLFVVFDGIGAHFFKHDSPEIIFAFFQNRPFFSWFKHI